MRRRLVATFVAIAAVLAGVAMVAGPVVVASVAARRVSLAFGAPIKIAWASWSPLSGTWTFAGVRVASAEGPPVFTASRVIVRAELRELLAGRYSIASLKLVGPHLRLRVGENAVELAAVAGGKQAGQPAGGLPPLSIGRLVVADGRISIEPQPLRAPVSVDIARLKAALTERRGALRLQGWARARVAGGRAALAGRLRSSPKGWRARVRVSGAALDASRLARLAGLASSRRVAGTVRLHAVYEQAAYGKYRKGPLVRGRLEASEVSLGDGKRNGLRVKTLAAPSVRAELAAHRVELGTVTAGGVDVWVRATAPRPEVPGLLGNPPPGPVIEHAAAKSAWTWSLERLVVTHAVVHPLSAGAAKALRLDVERAVLGPFGNAGGEKQLRFSLRAALAAGGRVVAQGGVGGGSRRVAAKFEFADLALPPLAPLVPTPLRVASGTASGRLELELSPRGAVATGNLTIHKLRTAPANAARPEQVVACHQIRIAIRRLATNPPSADLDQVDMQWPYVFIERTEHGTFPFSLSGAPHHEDNAPTVPTLRVRSLALEHGRIDFCDTTRPERYCGALAGIQARASGIALPPLRITRLEGQGKVDELSPLKFTVSVGSAIRAKVEVRDLALRPFNPYLGSVSSYTVSSGSLRGHGELTLERSHLEVSDHLVLSDFSLAGGSHDDFLTRQLGIPLSVALMLMKDYRGEIALDLPLSGDVDSPSFSVGALVLQALVGAVRGAVLSPLNVLGRVVLRRGRIERFTLSPVPFPPGSAKLDTAGRERLLQVARVMKSHRDLALEIRGVVAAADARRLRDQAALEALGRGPGARRLRAFLRARLAGKAAPRLSRKEQRQLAALRKQLGWPARALRRLAARRGRKAARALRADFGISAKRLKVMPPRPPRRHNLAAAPGVALELASK